MISAAGRFYPAHAAMRVLYSGPDCTFQLPVVIVGRIIGVGPINRSIKDLIRNARKRIMKMVGRFYHQNCLGGRVNAKVREYVRVEHLAADGVQNDVDTANSRSTHCRPGAQRCCRNSGPRREEPGVPSRRRRSALLHLQTSLRRSAGAVLRFHPLTDRCARQSDPRSTPGRHSGFFGLSISCRIIVLSPGTPPPGLSQTSAMTTGPLAAVRCPVQRVSGAQKLRPGGSAQREQFHSKALCQCVSPLDWALSVTTTIRVPRSGTSPAMNP